MKIDPRAPVIVGVGQALQRASAGGEPREPVALMLDALRRAGEDSATGERLLRGADSVRCVPALSWHYRDAAALLAEGLGAHPRETVQSAAVGGDGPQVLLNDTARAIAAGELDVALLGGGEAVASVRGAQRDGRVLAWTIQDERVRPTRTLGRERAGVDAAEAAVGLAPPVCMYALIETAVRGARATRADAHLASIAGLWSRFSEVGARNPHAWLARAYTPAQIATPTSTNRLVCAPYTKLLSANIQVDMAAGVILASAEAAQRAGVPRERWVFVHAGAHAQDEWHVSERRRLDASPAIHAVGRAVCQHAGVALDELAHIDLYSCFPAAVQIAARELGLALDDPARPLTVTGGLTFAGGPGNNYSMHAIATLVERLREQPDAYGLATALGWYVTKHAAGIYSARPPRQPFASLAPRPARPPARRASANYAGGARIEAYTVSYQRDATPEAAIIAALTCNDERALIRSTAQEVIAQMLAEDPLGEPLEIAADQRIDIGRAAPAH
ncbi:MAG TPA: hypothetical protein VMD79_14365 [Solirubrobacteraceae bacterium]|nr:hypothetical protein [Solirubrobacteraceae bacterium]